MKVVKYNDNQLIDRFQKGDQYAFAELITKYTPSIKLFINRYVKDELEKDDIYQDICIKIYKNLIRGGYYAEEGKFKNWVMRVTHNATFQIYRNRHRYDMVYTEDMQVFEDYQENKQNPDIVRTHIEEWLLGIPEEQRVVLKLHFFDQLKYSEIAEVLNVSLNTVLGRARYGKINLRKVVPSWWLDLFLIN